METILKNTELLARQNEMEKRMLPKGAGYLPSLERLKEMIRLVKAAIFPDFFDIQRDSTRMRSYFVGVNLEKLHSILRCEISSALRVDRQRSYDDAENQACSLASKFIDQLPEIKRLLLTDIMAIYNNDPAATDFAEIVLCYPGFIATANYRVAHALLLDKIPVIPRILTEIAHSHTGIDINPGAQIGEYFAIDHGTGVVIGETSVIGNHCTIYQGVTLGAKNFSFDSEGHPINIPRHPILEDNVTIYSNSSILGRITVGHDSIIGGNVWLTESVAPGSKILQSPATPCK